VNFAACPDDAAHLRADPTWRRGTTPLIMKCPECGKRFTLGEAGVVEIEPNGGQNRA
jgi:hypothetical protein